MFYNAYLPVLTRHHPDVKEAYRTPNADRVAISEKVSNMLSTSGFATGYTGGILAFFVAFAIVWKVGTEHNGPQIGISATGIWWFIFLFFPLMWLRARPGVPLPPNENFFFYSYKRGNY